MAYEVLEVIELPVQVKREVHPGITVDVPSGEALRKEPGQTITKAEFKEHGQGDEEIAHLIKSKAIREA